MAVATFDVEIKSFETKALLWAQKFQQVSFLKSNGYQDEYSSIEAILAVDAANIFESNYSNAFEKLELFKAKHTNKWMFGFLSYDLKNEIEPLSTSFSNPLDFSDITFFIPKTIIKFYKSSIEISADEPQKIFNAILKSEEREHWETSENINIQKRFTKEEYLNAFDKMMHHIHRGDIYEVNLCQEFYAENISIDPLATYLKLNQISPTPFSNFVKLGDRFILSASPERFLAKRGSTLLSQPIKGTAPRGKSIEEDDLIIEQLRNNPKEIAENVMIVDLVRNDLTRSALPGTVSAERKLEVHSFKQVHQLISTITCTQNPEITDIETIKNTFPPGSMTGAPKISAMKLCDQYENSRRGVYSGALGYFNPNGDFDFNVVIRTILYNHKNSYLSFHTGGAITIDAVAENEYAECLLKASAILQTLDTKL